MKLMETLFFHGQVWYNYVQRTLRKESPGIPMTDQGREDEGMFENSFPPGDV
ncbi:hypothetical protein CBFG_02452 [Clostridiales bacterium 1_7_47FAA]|nr:hypothetical protein CBFG_02452 [Clostridiales bacterium 1_7_47FAA]